MNLVGEYIDKRMKTEYTKKRRFCQMKVINCIKYGPPDVLEITNIDKPKPKNNEILIKNYATTVTVADCRVRGFRVPASFWLSARLALGFVKPRQSILGAELSGIIEEVGKDVSKFRVGNEIFATTSHNFGAYSEYICINENDVIALKPKNLSFEQATALPFGGITALHFLKKSKIKTGEKILIFGASGSIGTYAVQLAKYFGAVVTGVCSTPNLELVKNLGADNVIDYTKKDLVDIDEKYDIFFVTVGKGDISKSIKLIKPYGRYMQTVADPFTEIKVRVKLFGTKINFIGGTYNANDEEINYIGKLAAEGIIKPVIDKQYSFDEIVSAHEYVEKGHKKGNVVIIINNSNKGMANCT
jgi:NADPH:quinone reductase-like Zn-dependent oxidoreductase